MQPTIEENGYIKPKMALVERLLQESIYTLVRIISEDADYIVNGYTGALLIMGGVPINDYRMEECL